MGGETVICIYNGIVLNHKEKKEFLSFAERNGAADNDINKQYRLRKTACFLLHGV